MSEASLALMVFLVCYVSLVGVLAASGETIIKGRGRALLSIPVFLIIIGLAIWVSQLIWSAGLYR
ncbi:hypothetical protein M1N46_00955 [Dehalococcoidia bacterium]|nr:hypothetical protein [Dehalococcoidia bacterium]